jgi:hypothetical protein
MEEHVMSHINWKSGGRWLALAGGLLFLLTACGGAGQEGLAVGDDAPSFTLPEANGDSVSLADYEGTQPVLLYFHMAMG